MLAAVLAHIGLLAQSTPAEPTTGSNVAVMVVGVILVTAVIAIVVVRRSKR